MKKGLMIAAGIIGVSLIASGIMKKINSNKSLEEKAADENSPGDGDNTEVKPKVKKTQNHNENMTRVNNSLICIKIKVFSK